MIHADTYGQFSTYDPLTILILTQQSQHPPGLMTEVWGAQ